MTDTNIIKLIPYFILGLFDKEILRLTICFVPITFFGIFIGKLINNKISDEWNSLNTLSNNASTIGSYDLEVIDPVVGENKTLDLIKNNNYDILFLVGQDNLKIKKKSGLIIYIGSHGDKGAEIADIVLPGATYTEQDGYYTNLEGKLQNAYKASYPPGEAREDWIIFKDLANIIKKPLGYKNIRQLREFIKRDIQSKKNLDQPPYKI